MIAVGVRDDGALLVADGEAAAVALDGGYRITSLDAAVARGIWQRPESMTVPAPLARELAEPLREMRRRIEGNPLTRSGPLSAKPPAPELERMLVEDRRQRAKRDHETLLTLGIVERNFNPAQPRDPGGDGGGQWIKSPVGAAKAVVKAVTKAVKTNQHRNTQRNLIVRPELAIANTPERVAENLNNEIERITGRRIPVEFGSSVRTAQEHAEGILRGLERFPDAKLTRVGRFSPDTYGHHGGVYATAFAVASSHGVIEFNDEWTTTERRSRYEAHLMLGTDSGFQTPGAHSPASTAIHEFGHIIDVGALGKTIHRRVGALLKERAAADGISRSALVKREISGYATKNLSELVAEVFTDVLINGDDASPLSREIFAILEAEYRAEHGGVA